MGKIAPGTLRDVHLTYGQLDGDSNLIAHGLRAIGLERGSRVVVMVRPGLDFFALVFALFKAGIVPVLIDPGIGLRNLKQCCREAEPEAFIGVSKAIWARRLLRWGSKTVRRTVLVAPEGAGFSGLGTTTLDDVRTAGWRAIDSDSEPPPVLSLQARDEPAAILFTSGSTGPPKGAVYTHGIFEAQVESFKTVYAIKPGEIDLCTFPLFALFAPALGMTAIIPDMDPTRPALVDPLKLFQAIDDFGVTNLFGSPALLRRLAAGSKAASRRLPTLNRIISAGAPVSARILEDLAPLLDPPAQVYTPYGATESLPVASIGSGEVLRETRHATDKGMGVCVGRPFPRMDAKIIIILDDAIPLWSESLRRARWRDWRDRGCRAGRDA